MDDEAFCQNHTDTQLVIRLKGIDSRIEILPSERMKKHFVREFAAVLHSLSVSTATGSPLTEHTPLREQIESQLGKAEELVDRTRKWVPLWASIFGVALLGISGLIQTVSFPQTRWAPELTEVWYMIFVSGAAGGLLAVIW
jgi:hypothetical protein